MKELSANKIAAVRLLNQQLASPMFDDACDVVDWFGMMQAQQYQMMRWAVAMRTRKPKFISFKTAFDQGRIIRTHLFRCTGSCQCVLTVTGKQLKAIWHIMENQ